MFDRVRPASLPHLCEHYMWMDGIDPNLEKSLSLIALIVLMLYVLPNLNNNTISILEPVVMRLRKRDVWFKYRMLGYETVLSFPGKLTNIYITAILYPRSQL